MPSADAINTNIPLDKLKFPDMKDASALNIKEVQVGHTHPNILSAKGAGSGGSDWDISNTLKYPSLQDFKTQGVIRQALNNDTKGKGITLPGIINTDEYGAPAHYKYDIKDMTKANPYSKLNAWYDQQRLGAGDKGFYDLKTNTLTKDETPFLKRAALEEKISNGGGFFHQPWLNVERTGATIPAEDIVDVKQSRLGEGVAAVNAVGAVHGVSKLRGMQKEQEARIAARKAEELKRFG